MIPPSQQQAAAEVTGIQGKNLKKLEAFFKVCQSQEKGGKSVVGRTSSSMIEHFNSNKSYK